MNRLLKTLKREEKNLKPVWLMRQAGRYLPEYRELRKEAGDFLNLCYNPKLATEVTLQPLKRFDLDAAIIFSDILVIPDALGVDVKFIKGEGPILQRIKDGNDLKNLSIEKLTENLSSVYEALSLTKSKIPKGKNLIGFCGSPWTISSYMIEGGSSKNFELAKIAAIRDTVFFDKLIELLIESISIHAINQINAGAEIIQLFDSWAVQLPFDLYEKYIINPNKRIVENIRKVWPETPIIGFPKNSSIHYLPFISETKIDAISIDSQMPISWIHDKIDIVTQGNIDPVELLASKDAIAKKIDLISEQVKDKFHIFNLGHGVIKETDPDNVEFLVNYIREK